MEAKHTPAPWKDGPVFQKDGRAIFVTDETKPGKWQKRLDDKSGVFSEEDARLIAAAPDLLKALIDREAEATGQPKSCGHEHSCVCVGEAARAAISKATGA